MKALSYSRFGGPEVLSWSEGWPEPTAEPDTIVVQVKAGGVNPKDVLLRKGRFRHTMARDPLPRIAGMEVAGEVVATGANAEVAVGTTVHGMTNAFCGGLHGEKAMLRNGEYTPMPSGIEYIEAAAIPLAAQTALQALRDYAGVKQGSEVLINGASGGVGHFAVQIAKALGARVTGVCSERNADFVRGFGADRVIDYNTEDVTALPGPFDCVFDVFGQYSARDFRRCLADAGRYVSTVPKAATLLGELLASTGLSRQSRLVNVRSRADDLKLLATWHQQGKLRAHVDATYPVERAMEAHKHVETKRTRGKVVLTFGD